jgi:hypothetical protein
MSSTVPPAPRRFSWPEFIRIVILVAAAVAVMAPFFTSDIIGGVDARWYAYMLADAVEQARHGHMLISVGEGPFAWNGSVHLFRSAPVYMAVARVWDFLTLQHLNPFALQHLTAITSAVAGTLGFYAAAVRLIPKGRWIATGISLIYLATPSWLSTVLNTEAYMSYMAFAAMPIVLYGNARTAMQNDGRGYVILGTGIALIWMCHPPIAFIATMATLVIQCGLIVGRGIVSWKNMAAGIATFAILGAYYFASMSEVPRLSYVHSEVHEISQLLGFALFIVGIGRFALLPRSFGWAICAGAGAIVVWMTDYPWLCWVASTAGIWLICVLVLRTAARTFFMSSAAVLLFMSTLAGAAFAEAWVGREGIFLGAVLAFADNMANIREVFSPLANPMDRIQMYQPGWGIIALFTLAVASLFGSRPLGAKLFFAVSLGLAICFIRLPLVSNFVIGRFPVDFAAMCGAPLALRITPVIASFTAMAGVAWVSTLREENRQAHLAAASILAALVLWSAYETIPFRQHSREMTGNLYSTDKALRPENAKLDAYAYLLQPIPAYFSHGKTDPMLESRLLDSSGKLLVGPMEDASIMERGGVQEIRMTTSPIPNSTTWFEAGPRITVEPHEHLLLRFEFVPDRNYVGYFILQAENAYREYHLPDSGQESAFGIGGTRTSVLSLWNTGTTAEHYKFSLSTEPGNDIPHSGAQFATLHVSRLNPSALPVFLKSLTPYRARVTSTAAATLETFRMFLPGYRATVDGNAAPVVESKQHLVSVPVPPGTHEVVVRFVGTTRIWVAAVVSGIGWASLIAYCLFSSIPMWRSRASAP